MSANDTPHLAFVHAWDNGELSCTWYVGLYPDNYTAADEAERAIERYAAEGRLNGLLRAEAIVWPAELGHHRLDELRDDGGWVVRSMAAPK